MKPQLLFTADQAAGNLRGSAVPPAVTDFNRLAAGRTIKAAGYLIHFREWPVPCLLLDDGSIIVTQADDEGNGPGVLELMPEDPAVESAMLGETRLKIPGSALPWTAGRG